VPVDEGKPQALDGEGESRVNWSWRYWQPWVAASLVSWAIWLSVLITHSDHPTQAFWPIWVTLPWGAVLLGNAGRRRK
jgi:hypothetical protein